MATQKEILADLQKKLYHPVYFLCGEEPFYIDQISNYIEKNVLDENESEFNKHIFYGRENSLAGIIDAAYRFPMMSNYQVIIVKEAQDLKDLVPKEKEGSKKKEKEKEDLLVTYLDKPQKSTLLVLCYKYKTLDKRTSLAKKLAKSAILFESKRIYDNQVPAWIESELKDRGFRIEHRALALLSEYLGNDLGKIYNEIGKLLINIKPGEEINVNHIEANIGISKDYNVFELQSALGQRDGAKAMRIIEYFASNPRDNPFILTMGVLFNFFSKVLIYHGLKDKSRNGAAASLGVSPYFIGDFAAAAKSYPLPVLHKVMHILSAYDLKSKGIGNASISEGELYRELVLKLIHVDKLIEEFVEEEM